MRLYDGAPQTKYPSQSFDRFGVIKRVGYCGQLVKRHNGRNSDEDANRILRSSMDLLADQGEVDDPSHVLILTA